MRKKAPTERPETKIEIAPRVIWRGNVDGTQEGEILRVVVGKTGDPQVEILVGRDAFEAEAWIGLWDDLVPDEIFCGDDREPAAVEALEHAVRALVIAGQVTR